jgi:hypothetical protein
MIITNKLLGEKLRRSKKVTNRKYYPPTTVDAIVHQNNSKEKREGLCSYFLQDKASLHVLL